MVRRRYSDTSRGVTFPVAAIFRGMAKKCFGIGLTLALLESSDVGVRSDTLHASLAEVIVIAIVADAGLSVCIARKACNRKHAGE